MQQVPTVFVVDDDVDLRQSLRALVQSVGLTVEVYPNAMVFLENLAPERPGCLVLDVRLPGMSGLELQKELVARGVDIPIIMTTGYSDVSVAVEAMKAGAFDFIEKPLETERVLLAVRNAVERKELEEEVGRLRLRFAWVLHRSDSPHAGKLSAGCHSCSEESHQALSQPSQLSFYLRHISGKQTERGDREACFRRW